MTRLTGSFAQSVAALSVDPSTAEGQTIIKDAVAAEELALQLEVRLRHTLQLALRFASKAGRPGRLAGRDVADALQGSGHSPALLAAALRQHGRQRRTEAHIEAEEAEEDPDDTDSKVAVARPLTSFLRGLPLRPPSAPVLEIRTLAEEGRPAPGVRSGILVLESLGSRRQFLPATLWTGLLDAPFPEGQLEEFRRLEAFFHAGRSAEVLACRDLLAMRPQLAHYVLQQVMQKLNPSPAELEALLQMLEVLSSQRGAGINWRDCLLAATLLCMTPSPLIGSWISQRRRAACLVAQILSGQHVASEFLPEICHVYSEALRPEHCKGPGAFAGAVLGLAALGPRHVEAVLLPALAEGRLADIVARWAALEPERSGKTPSAKRMPSAGEAEVYAALTEAASVLERWASPHTPHTSRVAPWSSSSASRECATFLAHAAPYGRVLSSWKPSKLGTCPHSAQQMRSSQQLLSILESSFGYDTAPLLASLSPRWAFPSL